MNPEPFMPMVNLQKLDVGGNNIQVRLFIYFCNILSFMDANILLVEYQTQDPAGQYLILTCEWVILKMSNFTDKKIIA